MHSYELFFRQQHERQYTDRIIMWAMSGPRFTIRARVILSLSSVLSAGLEPGRPLNAAFLVLHDGRSNLTCSNVSSWLPLPCDSVPEWDANHSCTLAKAAALRANTVYLGTFVPDARLDALQRYISRAHQDDAVGSAHPLLTSPEAALGNNFRLLADKLALSLGVRQALYLDADACVTGPLHGIFEANTTMPIVAASRGPAKLSTLENTSEYYMYSAEARPLLSRMWGFNDAARQSFNAGVMLINAIPFCVHDILGRVLHVAEVHSSVPAAKNITKSSSPNNAFIELAAAGLCHHVPLRYNCRSREQVDTSIDSCVIQHEHTHQSQMCRYEQQGLIAQRFNESGESYWPNSTAEVERVLPIGKLPRQHNDRHTSRRIAREQKREARGNGAHGTQLSQLSQSSEPTRARRKLRG
uniref:Nucleotide-diphospho-sugar transferase domain-containing protein n=1 Tax=Chrysotila carterae TaxID=13221 RepID=A0A7S4C085_CHRCT